MVKFWNSERADKGLGVSSETGLDLAFAMIKEPF
jgi:hypothetical protein